MSRARFLRQVFVLVSVGILVLVSACSPASQETEESGNAGPVITGVDAIDATYNFGGYTSKVSVAQGESIDFHVSNATPATGQILIYREGATDKLMATIPNVMAGAYDCQGKYATGCDWPVAASFTVPLDWPSGVYIAQISTSNGKRSMIFWVREDDPGSTARLLFLSSVNTHQAYNDYGGGSLYGFGETELSTKLTLNRPYNGGVGKYNMWEAKFIPWLENAGYDVEYATTYDLEFHPDLLSHYDVAMVAGHSEYWTWDMRQRVDEFIENGGRFVNLAGNVMWWQIRFEDDGRTLVGYKNYKKDPIQTAQGTTDTPDDYPILDSPIKLTGLFWPYGGYPSGNGDGYYAVKTDHWVYEGTGVKENQLIGKGASKETSIHDKESDGMPFNCAADGSTILGAPGYSGIDNFTVLGLTTVYSKQRDLDNFTMMGITTRPGGGALFNAGTTGWVLGLKEPAIDRMTRNVLDRFLAGDVPTEPHNPDTDYFVYDRFNCYDVGRDRFTSQQWKADVAYNNFVMRKGPATIDLTTTCGYSGSGLQVNAASGTASTTYTLNLRPDWAATDRLYAHFYLKLTNLGLPEGKTVTLTQEYHDTFTATPPAAMVLQARKQGGVFQMRYQPAAANLPWVNVPADRFFLVETGLDRTTGRVALWIDGAGYDQTVDLSAVPALNRYDLGAIKPTASMTGYYCMDELILDETRYGEPPLPTPTPTATGQPGSPTPTATTTLMPEPTEPGGEVDLTPTAAATATITATPTATATQEGGQPPEWKVYLGYVSGAPEQ